MATSTRAGRPGRTLTTRKQRIARALTPTRMRRAHARCKRRARAVRKTYRSLRRVGARVGERARRVRQAPGKAGATLARSYRRARATVRPDRGVRCSCGTTVPAGEVEAHLRRHQQRHEAAQRRAAKARGSATRGQDRQARRLTSRPDLRYTKARAVTPSRGEAARTAGGWVAVGAVLVAAPLFFHVGSPWLGLAGAGCVAAGGVAYAVERRWGISNHTTRQSRRALRAQARASGCSSACMVSTKPATTCKCPCGGATHGSARAA